MSVSPPARSPLTFDPAVPRRTLGLMMAIILMALVLGVIPIVPALLILLIDLSGHVIVPEDPIFWLPAIFGVLTVIASVMAWIGRPPATRQALLTVATLTLGVDLIVNSRPTLELEVGKVYGSSLDSGVQAVSLCLLVFQILIYIFALWYLNRDPAKAFYRRSRPAK